MRRFVSTLLALALCLSLYVPARAAGEFTDVPSTHVFYQSVQSCVERGLLRGYDDGTFRPASNVTRAQFVVMLTRVFYPGEAESAAYGSWKNTAWYAPSCAVLADHGAMTYGEKYWKDPAVMGVSITRRDMAQFLNASLVAGGYQASESDKAAARSRILDYAEVGDYYAEAVKTVFALGIITGFPDGRFMGTSTMTRGQAAAILDRTLQCIAQGPGVLKPLSQNQESGQTARPGAAELEEKAMDILRRMRLQYPEDTDYSAGYPDGNNSDVRTATYPYERSRDPSTHTSNTLGCGGWATQISDAIFGQGGYPCRKVSAEDARPGDTMVMTDKNGRLVHVAPISARSSMDDGNVILYITEAATDSQGVYHIHWDRTYTQYQSGGDYGYDIYTRYPA